MPEILKRLETLGFSSYEAKAYYALLQKYPANGYEISKLSQIPPSKIYETLQKLKRRGAVIDSQTEPVLYLPLEPNVLFTRIKAETEKLIDTVIADLSETKPVDTIDLTWNLRGGQTIYDKIAEVIDRAQREIYLSIWPDQAEILNERLASAMSRGVYVIAATFGCCRVNAHETVNLESCAQHVSLRTGAKLSVVVCDNEEVVIGEFAVAEGSSKGVWTKTPSVTLISKEYIKHDIMTNLLISYLGDEEYKKFCEQYELVQKLRIVR